VSVQNLPNIGDKFFLMCREVVISKVYTSFQLIKVHYTEESTEFFVDVCAVTDVPDNTNSISIQLLRRNHGG
jgi:hypothetical protein